jgi:hypothetical protein
MRGVLYAVADYVLTGATVSEPRICDRCDRITERLTPGQHTAIGARVLPACRRWRCGGRLHLTRRAP